MSNYKITDNVKDEFPFEIRDMKFVMRYPRVSEVEAIQDLTDKLKEAQDEKREDEVKTISKQLEGFIYQFITPVDHETPVKEALEKENIRVMRNFNRMIREELAIS